MMPNYNVESKRMISDLVSKNFSSLQHRIKFLEQFFNKDRTIIAGYGSKGRSMALFLRGIGKEVFVIDRSLASKKAALSDGFELVDSDHQNIFEETAVILCACQFQIEQSKSPVFSDRFAYYEEASFYFDRPYHYNRTSDFPKFMRENTDLLTEMYQKLQQRERNHFLENIAFRSSLNPEQLAYHRKATRDMWFDVPEEYGQRCYERFLDVGAFDGDTLAEAHLRLGFKEAIAIEANPAFFDDIRRLDKFYKRLTIHQVAAWSANCKLSFTLDDSGMISVSEGDEGSLKAEKLDSIIDEPIDFLKMDIEGAELSALGGAENLLLSGPDLAIAAYHRPSDLYDIFNRVEEVYGDMEFDFHMRHYSDCLDDTIFYFLRK